MNHRSSTLLVVATMLACGAWHSAIAQATGQALFETHCATCHQSDGSGTVGLAPALKGEHWQVLNKNRLYLPTVLLKGLSGRIDVNGQTFVGSMPAFAGQLDDASVMRIMQHVQALQGEASPQVNAAELTALRTAPGGPPLTRQLRLSLLGGR